MVGDYRSTGAGIPWHVVAGFGAHIKATSRTLTIVKGGRSEEFAVDSIPHLLIIGGHTLHTSVVQQMLRHGKYITFFEANGNPVGYIAPYRAGEEHEIRDLQKTVPVYPYAVAIAKGAIKRRLLMIEKTVDAIGDSILYRGEIQFMHKALEEVDYLVRMEEVRRIHRLTRDMYYEIMARTIPPERGFRRRTGNTSPDVVNAVLSLGYAMLTGNVCIALVGAHLDPDHGLLHTGRLSLAEDLGDLFRTEMVDRGAFALARDGIEGFEFECTETRCNLSDSLVHYLIRHFHHSICQAEIDEQVKIYSESLVSREQFRIVS